MWFFIKIFKSKFLNKNIYNMTNNNSIGKVSYETCPANGIRWIEKIQNIKNNLLNLISILCSVYQAQSNCKIS